MFFASQLFFTLPCTIQNTQEFNIKKDLVYSVFVLTRSYWHSFLIIFLKNNKTKREKQQNQIKGLLLSNHIITKNIIYFLHV